MASYIKFIEQGGAMVVPIFHTSPDSEILDLIDQINGVVYPGGSTELITDDGTLTEFSRKGKLILDRVKELNNNGVHFPVFAICMGFEEISVIEAPFPDTLAKRQFDSENIANNITFVSDPYSSKLYKNSPEHLLESLALDELTFNSHHDGVYLKTYKKYPALRQYKVLAVSYDKKGIEYVSNIEHRVYPIFGFQYHPEKNQFLWKEDLAIPHSETAIELAIYYSRFLAQHAKMNGNHFRDPKELMKLRIENYPIVMFQSSSIQDSYVFNL